MNAHASVGPELASRVRRAWLRSIALLGSATFAHAACVYDGDQPCGVGQVLDHEYLRCVCAPGSAYTPAGCVACGANEVADAQGCSCVEGYVRPTPDAACEPAPSGLGEACDENSPCADPTYSQCVTSANGGYCTNIGCGGPGDCQGGYACDTSAVPSVCRRPPVGQGRSCQTSADCADSEATYCDSFVTHSCLVQGCTLSPDDCFTGSECCDLSGFNVPRPICVAEGTCPT
jgi:hypothetical protein